MFNYIRFSYGTGASRTRGAIAQAFTKHLWLQCVCVLMAFQMGFSSEANAADVLGEDSDTAASLSRWISLGWLSWHTHKNSERNGLNYGIGTEIDLSERWSFAGGVYHNSFEATSYYAGGIWHAWSHERWGLGVMLGVANGYRNVNQGDIFPYVFPMLQYQGSWLGANLAVVPPFSHATNGLVALQFKVRY